MTFFRLHLGAFLFSFFSLIKNRAWGNRQKIDNQKKRKTVSCKTFRNTTDRKDLNKPIVDDRKDGVTRKQKKGMKVEGTEVSTCSLMEL